MTSKTNVRREPGSKRKLYPAEFKLRAVQLYTEEGFTFEMLCRELGICKSSLGRWIKQYQEQGVAGLEPHAPVPSHCPSAEALSSDEGIAGDGAADAQRRRVGRSAEEKAAAQSAKAAIL